MSILPTVKILQRNETKTLQWGFKLLHSIKSPKSPPCVLPVIPADVLHMERCNARMQELSKLLLNHLCVPLCWAHTSDGGLHQANRSMEKDCPVNEVWSGATKGCVCHRIYSAAAPWFPAAVKQWGGDWSKLRRSCQPPDCSQPFDSVALSSTNCLSPVPRLTHVHTDTSHVFPNLPHLLISIRYSVRLLFY